MWKEQKNDSEGLAFSTCLLTNRLFKNSTDICGGSAVANELPFL